MYLIAGRNEWLTTVDRTAQLERCALNLIPWVDGQLVWEVAASRVDQVVP
jgi:hypothetical protein